MLKNIKDTFSKLLYIFNSVQLKSIYIIVIFTCVLNSFNHGNNLKYEEAFFSLISSTLFVFVLIGTLFSTTCIILRYFDKDYSLIIRYKSKINYFKNLCLIITLGNLIIFISAISLTWLITTIKFFGMTTFTNISHYNIPYIVYNFFTIIKYFMVINILSLIGVCIYKNFNKFCCYVYYVLILISYYTIPVSANSISYFSIKNLFFKYHIFPYQYASFSLEISSFTITFCSMILLLSFIIFLTLKYNKIRIDE